MWNLTYLSMQPYINYSTSLRFKSGSDSIMAQHGSPANCSTTSLNTMALRLLVWSEIKAVSRKLVLSWFCFYMYLCMVFSYYLYLGLLWNPFWAQIQNHPVRHAWITFSVAICTCDITSFVVWQVACCTYNTKCSTLCLESCWFVIHLAC